MQQLASAERQAGLRGLRRLAIPAVAPAPHQLAKPQPPAALTWDSCPAGKASEGGTPRPDPLAAAWTVWMIWGQARWEVRRCERQHSEGAGQGSRELSRAQLCAVLAACFCSLSQPASGCQGPGGCGCQAPYHICISFPWGGCAHLVRVLLVVRVAPGQQLPQHLLRAPPPGERGPSLGRGGRG